MTSEQALRALRKRIDLAAGEAVGAAFRCAPDSAVQKALDKVADLLEEAAVAIDAVLTPEPD